MGKRGPEPKQFIDTSWRAELAYCVGLLASDGCLGRTGHHIDLTSIDVEQVIHFQRALGITHNKIGKKLSGAGNSAYRVQFRNVLFYEWLVNVGLTPAKSRTIGPLDMPDKYFFDFYRGCFDGDGSMYAFWDTRWRSSYTYFTMLTSASLPFLEWVNSKTLALAGVKGSIRKSVRAYELRFAKRASRVLFDTMYARADAPRLTRKFAKLQEIIRIDDVHRK